MDLQLWTKAEQKKCTILALRGDEVHCLEVNGDKAHQDAARIVEGLQQGQEPAGLGATSVASMKAGSIAKARACPDNEIVEFHPEGTDGKVLKFPTTDKTAADVIRTVLARSGRNYQEGRQDITAGEAMAPSIGIGVVFAIFWTLLYLAASDIESGKGVDVEHGRRRGWKQLFAWLAGMLGMNGTMLVGAAVLGLLVLWAAVRLIKRPQRTVWTPATA